VVAAVEQHQQELLVQEIQLEQEVQELQTILQEAV